MIVKVRAIFWCEMTNYITKRIQVIFRCVFEGILAYPASKPKSTLGLLLFFVEIMSEKVILDNKKSYLVYFKKFHFWCVFEGTLAYLVSGPKYSPGLRTESF